MMMMAIAAALAILSPAAPALAQGTMGTVPDPISSRELDGYADRLGLSEQQQQAVLAAHDDYREQFRVLRETDIEKLLQDAQGFRMGGFRPGGFPMDLDRKQIEKSLKSMETILSRIAAIDNGLFDQVQMVLTEEQLALMPRVRQARERVRYQAGLSRMVSFLNPASHVDLSALMLDYDLSTAEKQAIDPILMSYEYSLTTGAKKLHEGASEMVLTMLEEMTKRGFGDPAQQDQNNRGQMFEAFRSVWSEVSQKLQEKAGAIASLNRRTLRDITPALSEDHASRLRSTYLQRAYPETFSGGQSNATRSFRTALRFDELSVEQKDTITAMAADHRATLDNVNDQMVDLIDENRKTSNFLDFDSERRRQFQQKLDALREKRTALNSAAIEALKGALGPDLAGKLDRRVAESSDQDERGSDQVRTFSFGGPGMGGMTAVQVARSTVADSDGLNPTAIADPYLPGPITERSIAQYALMLGVDGDRRAVLDTLHEEYRAKFQDVEEGDIKAVREASQNLWTTGENGQFKGPTPEAIEQLYGLRRKALGAIQTLDGGFFDDVQSTLLAPEDEERLQRVRLARQRDVYNRGDGGSFMNFGGRDFGRQRNRDGGPGAGPGAGNRGGRGDGRGPGPSAGRMLGMFGGGNDEASIDLAMLVDRISLTSDDRAKADAALVEYERTIAEGFKKRYEAAMKMQQTMDKMIAQNTQMGGDGQRRNAQGGGGSGGPGGAGGAGAAFREAMETDGRASRQAATEIAALNKATLGKLTEALSPVAAESLRMDYYRKAYPGIYQDSRSAQPHLSAALALDDLSPQQQTQISNLAAEYRAAYDQLSDQLVKLQSSMSELINPAGRGGGGVGPSGGGGGQRNWESWQEQQRSIEKITFDRDDLSDKTMSRLRAVLTEEQTQRLGGLREGGNP